MQSSWYAVVALIMKKKLLPTTIRSFISREMMHHNTLRRNTGKQKVGIFELLHIGSTKEV